MSAMRADKLLFFLRLTKTRALAQALIEAGHLRIDRERTVQASSAVKPGHTLTIALHNHVRVIRIDRLPVRRGPASEAQACYAELVEPQPIDARAGKL